MINYYISAYRSASILLDDELNASGDPQEMLIGTANAKRGAD